RIADGDPRAAASDDAPAQVGAYPHRVRQRGFTVVAMDILDDAIVWFNDKYGYVLIVLLVGAGLYFGVRTKAVQLRLLPEMGRTLKERPPSPGSGGAGSISAFRAFSISAASRVGTGNVAGVAVAIT